MHEQTNTPKKTIFYPASYLVMTVTSLLVLASLAGLGALLIDYWFNGVSTLLNEVLLFHWVATLAVVVPIHLLAYWQVRHTDKSVVTTFSLRFAHGLLGGYLFITVATCVALSTWLISLWLNVWFGTGQLDAHLWAASLALLQAIVWFAYATWHFMRSRADQSRPRYYVITVSALSVIVLVLSLVFPAVAYRDVAKDFVKETDLSYINTAIGEYVERRENLPTKLTDLSGINSETVGRYSNYEYIAHGETKFGIFGYVLCASFAKSKDKGYYTGWDFSSHSAGKQCFTRTTISFAKMNQDFAAYAQQLENGAAKINAAIQSFLLGAKKTVDQEISGVEKFASGQVKQLEGNLESLEGGTTELQQEMQRLEGNMTSLEGDTGSLAQDFTAVQKFLHDLGCLFGGCKPQ